MTSEKIERINQLARKSRTPEGLTGEEKAEQARLREEYAAGWRASLESHLQNTYVVDAEGNRHKLKKKGDTIINS